MLFLNKLDNVHHPITTYYSFSMSHALIAFLNNVLVVTLLRYSFFKQTSQGTVMVTEKTHKHFTMWYKNVSLNVKYWFLIYGWIQDSFFCALGHTEWIRMLIENVFAPCRVGSLFSWSVDISLLSFLEQEIPK